MIHFIKGFNRVWEVILSPGTIEMYGVIVGMICVIIIMFAIGAAISMINEALKKQHK